MITIKSFSSVFSQGQRPNQEDYIHPFSPQADERIFVLCDGMGGHGHGEVASKTIAEAVYNYLTEIKPESYTAEHFQDALNFGLSELKNVDTFQDEKAMGTTIVIVAINKKTILVGHVGDSRCYQFDIDGTKKFRTKDHSKVQEAVDAEILTEDEAWSNQKKNILTRCILSTSTEVEIDVDELSISNQDTIVICSDGVTDALRDQQIQSIVINRTAESIAQAIKNECEISSHDNFSAIILQFSQDEDYLSNIVNSTSSLDKNKDNNYCRKCRAPIGNSRFCSKCGTEIAQPAQTNHVRPSMPSFKKNTRKNQNSTLLILGGFIVGGIFLWSLKSCFFQNPHNDDLEHEFTDYRPIEQRHFNQLTDSICEFDSPLLTQDSIIHK